MFKTETRVCKTHIGRTEKLFLLATPLLCFLFASHILYSELTFKGTPSQQIKFTDQRQFLSVDRNPYMGTAVNKDASYEIKQDVSTAVNKDANYEIQQDVSTAVNKDANYEIKQDASYERKQDVSIVLNEDASYEIKQDENTVVNKDVSYEINQDASTVLNNKDDHNQSLQYLLTRLIGGENRTRLDSTGFACDTRPWTYTVCVTNKPVIIDTTTMQVHLQQLPDTKNTTTIIRPYALYPNEYTTQVTITTTKPTRPTCDHNHQHPAVIFSTGGFTGNTFHAFDETIIPLFITTRLFKSRVHFLVVDHFPLFFQKYRRLLQGLSDHEIINTANDSSVHCFPGAIVGLRFHKVLGINPSETPQNYCSMLVFKEIIRQTYKLKTKSVSSTQNPHKLLLLSRQRTRKFLNQEEMVKMMEELRFQVIIASSEEETSNIEKFSPVVNSCSVMVGVQGAGMTNEIYLPNGAVMILVRPLGFQDYLDVFSEAAPDMGLKYLEYKIKPEESSLIDEYGLDHPVLQNTSSVTSKGWIAGAAMYLEKQNVRLDMNRFRGTLVEALRFIGQNKDVSNTRYT